MTPREFKKQIEFIEENKLSTPVTFYDERNLSEALAIIKDIYGNDLLIFYALKSCYNKNILKSLSTAGIGIEILSELEYDLAVESGFKSIVLNGMGRSSKLLSRAVADDNIIIIDTINDLKKLSQIAKVSNNTLRIGFRLRLKLSELEPSNSYVSEEHPLGNYLDSKLVAEFLKFCHNHKNVRWEMLHVHLTINETSPQIYKAAITQLAAALQYLESYSRLRPSIINLGGGFEVYDPDLKPAFIKLFKDIKQAFNTALGGYKMAIEPGRYLSAYAGYTIGKVLDIKQLAKKYWIITDIGTNTLIPIPNTRYKLALPKPNNITGKFIIGITDGITSPANNIIFETRIENLPPLDSYICIENTGAYTDVYSTFWAYSPHVVCNVDIKGNMLVYRSPEDIEQLRKIIFK